MIIANPQQYISHDDHEPVTTAGRVAYFFWDLFKVVCVSLAIIIPVRYFLIQPFYVKGASMEPSFLDHEYLIIDEISYRFREPERGDIVVFRYPKDQTQFFIKRIVGLPGETVEVQDGYVFIHTVDGDQKYLLNEVDYLSPDVKTQGEKIWTLSQDEYYVMGDNRDHSLDSRVFGPVHRALIVGRVWLRGWPLDRVTVFKDVEYQK